MVGKYGPNQPEFIQAALMYLISRRNNQSSGGEARYAYSCSANQ